MVGGLEVMMSAQDLARLLQRVLNLTCHEQGSQSRFGVVIIRGRMLKAEPVVEGARGIVRLDRSKSE